MKLLYGTGNPAKLGAMKRRLKGLNLEIIGLEDLDQEIPNILEEGNTPLENARQKAMGYYKAFGIPIFSCDTGLYIDGIPEELQPGIHVRRINGNYASDEELLIYFSNMAKQYGNLTARYKNAICLIINENEIYEAMNESMESKPFIITEKAHRIINKGFPIDSLALSIETGNYFYDMEEGEVDKVAVEEGFFCFFQNSLEKYFLQKETNIEVKFYDTVSDDKLKFAVIVSKSNGKWVLCKHKERETYEIPGGHRELGEEIRVTATRELEEETGAINYKIKPVSVYSVIRNDETKANQQETFGMLFFAEIETFEEELHSEMEYIILTEELPNNWTYPFIYSRLLEKVEKFLK
jgi:Xanthosine triphosphate pyrophosphatase